MLAGEAGGLAVGQLQGLAVVAGGGAVLAEVVEADGQVVGDVGLMGGEAVGLKPGLLGFGPALLAGQCFGQGEVRCGRVGLAGEVISQARFGLLRVGGL